MILHCTITMVAILRSPRAPPSATAPAHFTPELPHSAAVTVAPGSADKHGHTLWTRRGQLEMRCLGWVQAVAWHGLQMVCREGRGEAVLGKRVLVAVKRRPSSGWGLLPGQWRREAACKQQCHPGQCAASPWLRAFSLPNCAHWLALQRLAVAHSHLLARWLVMSGPHVV